MCKIISARNMVLWVHSHQMAANTGDWHPELLQISQFGSEYLSMVTGSLSNAVEETYSHHFSPFLTNHSLPLQFLETAQVWKDVEPGQLAAEFQKDLWDRHWSHWIPGSFLPPTHRIRPKGRRTTVRSCRSWRRTSSRERSVALATHHLSLKKHIILGRSTMFYLSTSAFVLCLPYTCGISVSRDERQFTKVWYSQQKATRIAVCGFEASPIKIRVYSRFFFSYSPHRITCASIVCWGYSSYGLAAFCMFHP